MNKPNEQLLQKWERNPLQYRKEIERAERQYAEEFSKVVNSGNRYYNLYEFGSPEWIKGIKEDTEFMLIWNRLRKFSSIISQHEHTAWMAQAKKEQEECKETDLKTLLNRYPIMGEA